MRKWPLALVLWLSLGAIVWAQVTVTNTGLIGAAGSGNGVTGYFADGTASVPSIGFASDADGTGTGFYRQAANVVELVNNAVPNTRFNTSGLLIISDTLGLFFGASADLKMLRGGAPGSLRINTGTTPTQSGTTCGTGPTISGNNTNGAVILGTAPGLPCTIVFNGTWTAAPHCSLNPEILTTGTTTVRATSITTTGFIVTSTAALVAADKVTWFCVGE